MSVCVCTFTCFWKCVVNVDVLHVYICMPIICKLTFTHIFKSKKWICIHIYGTHWIVHNKYRSSMHNICINLKKITYCVQYWPKIEIEFCKKKLRSSLAKPWRQLSSSARTKKNDKGKSRQKCSCGYMPVHVLADTCMCTCKCACMHTCIHTTRHMRQNGPRPSSVSISDVWVALSHTSRHVWIKIWATVATRTQILHECILQLPCPTSLPN